MTTVVVVGAGMMGSALCVPLADRGHDVRLVGTHLDEEIVGALLASQPHPGLGVALPSSVVPASVDKLADHVADADVIALGVSSAGIGWASEQLAPLVAGHQRLNALFMITKGLDCRDGRVEILPDVVARQMPLPERAGAPAAVAGPCIAGEIARRVPTCVLVASRDERVASTVSELLATSYYVALPQRDVVGVEACAALKNAYAMALGFPAGAFERDGGTAGKSVAYHNVEAALFAQSVTEMRRWLNALGGDPDTAAGLAGVGDLDVTDNGGRTGRFGRHLGRGLSRDEAIGAMQGATLECLEILRELRPVRHRLQKDGTLGAVPLFDFMVRVALDGAPVNPIPLSSFFAAEST